MYNVECIACTQFPLVCAKKTRLETNPMLAVANMRLDHEKLKRNRRRRDAITIISTAADEK